MSGMADKALLFTQIVRSTNSRSLISRIDNGLKGSKCGIFVYIEIIFYDTLFQLFDHFFKRQLLIKTLIIESLN